MKKRIQYSEPLRNKDQIELVRALLKETRYGLRNRLIFDLGINNGLRTGDILKLKAKDVCNVSQLQIREGKTGKSRMIIFNSSLQQEIITYINNRKYQSEWLFPNPNNPAKHITTQAVYRLFKRLANGHRDLRGLTAHSMRRTFGYWYYHRTHDIATLMTVFNHSSQAITLRYIGVTDDKVNHALRNFKL